MCLCVSLCLPLSPPVQLWSVGNYHWYLKQSLRFGGAQEAPVCVAWDPERPLQLHLVTHGWTCLTYHWGWTTDRSQEDTLHDNANVAVIDGGEGQSDVSGAGWRRDEGSTRFNIRCVCKVLVTVFWQCVYI